MTKAAIRLELQTDARRRGWATCAREVAWVAGAFVLVVAITMLVSVIREHRDPLTGGEFEQLKKQLVLDGTNESLKERIRDIDLRIRKDYFVRRAFLLHGAWLMLGGAVLLVVSVKLAADWGYEPYLPTGPAPSPPSLNLAFKLSFAAVGVALAGFFVALRAPRYHGMDFAALAPVRPAATAASAALPTAAAAAVSVTDDEMKQNWPAFRGFGGLGVSTGDYPKQWDAPAKKNILWKTAIPLPGKNSPIVWKGNIYLAGGSPEKREVYCLDAATGAIKWTRPVGAKGSADLKLNEDTSYAPSTMATDGQRVFAIFPTGELAAFEFDGKPAWNKNLGPLKNQYGHAASLIAKGGLVFVQLDQGGEKEHLSAMYGFDSATGKQVWKTPRPVPASWSSPVIVPGPAGPQLVALAEPWVIAYEPKTGAEIWRSQGMGGEVAPSPAFANGVLYAAVERADFIGIKLDGKGDVTKTHLTKNEVDILPDIVSPVAAGDRVLLVSTGGTLCLVEGKSGKTVWTQDIDAGFNSSPVLVGNLIYLADKKGITHILEWGETFKEIAQSPLGQEVSATPAFAGGKIFLRGQTDLFCIGQEKGGGQ